MNQASTLTGWKEIANFLGYHIRTIRRWHYERKKLPFEKTGPSPNNRVRIRADKALAWVKQLQAIPNKPIADGSDSMRSE